MNPQITYEEFAECRLTAEARSVRLGLEKIKEYCRARGLRPAFWEQVELAVAEGLNNAIEHGCALFPYSIPS